MRHSATLALGIGLATSLVASALSGVFVPGASIGTVSNEHRLSITPRSGAFSIWGLIYTLLGSAFVHSVVVPDSVPLVPALCLGAAEALSGIWVPLFVTNTTASLALAALVLVAATVSAVSAVALLGPIAGAGTWQRAVFVHGAFALFAGWLLCAAFLGVGIALASAYDSTLPRWSLLVLSFAAALAAAATRNPVLALPCAWALLWQPEIGGVEILSLLVCSGGVATAALR